jgi:hypothetical protein
LNQQYNRNPEVRWRRFKDPMFGFDGEHSLGRSLLALIEMFHIGSWILPMYFRLSANWNMHADKPTRLTVAPSPFSLGSASTADGVVR